MRHLTFPPFSQQAADAVRQRLDSLAKVPGSLGELEELAIRLGGITDDARPSFARKAVVLFAGDHGITAKGVSATGPEVTAIQVRNFLAGGGTINAFCRNAGARLVVVDVGMADALEGGGRAGAPQGHARLPRFQRRPDHDAGRSLALSPGGHRHGARGSGAGHAAAGGRRDGHRQHLALFRHRLRTDGRAGGRGDGPWRGHPIREPAPQDRLHPVRTSPATSATRPTRWTCWPRWAARSWPL